MKASNRITVWGAIALVAAGGVGWLLIPAGKTPSTAAGAASEPAPRTSPSSQPSVAAAAPTAPATTPNGAAAPLGWRKLTRFDFAALPIADMPADDGNISPIASEDQEALGSSLNMLKRVEAALPGWAPGHVADPVQRVRNYLFILGAADFAQSSIERFLPGVVLAHLQKEFSAEELPQLLCWVALHPWDGDHSVLKDKLLADLGAANQDPDEVRNRTHYYGVKLTRWTIGW